MIVPVLFVKSKSSWLSATAVAGLNALATAIKPQPIIEPWNRQRRRRDEIAAWVPPPRDEAEAHASFLYVNERRRRGQIKTLPVGLSEPGDFLKNAPGGPNPPPTFRRAFSAGRFV